MKCWRCIDHDATTAIGLCDDCQRHLRMEIPPRMPPLDVESGAWQR